MNYFLKIIKKNDAGWFHLYATNDTSNTDVDVLNEIIGYAPIDGVHETRILLPNSNDNFLKLVMGQWRNGQGDPGPRGRWHVVFQIVYMDANNGYAEEMVTPIYDVSGLTYSDAGELPIIINPCLSCEELKDINDKKYTQWKIDSGRAQ